MTTAATTPQRTSLAEFWRGLPREGRLLLSVAVVEFVGTGLVLPFWVVYLHEVRDIPLGTVGLLMGLQPLAGLLVGGPGGALIDRIGARRVLIAAQLMVMAGQVVMAFADGPAPAGLGLMLSGASFALVHPAVGTLVSTIVPSEGRPRYFGLNFTLLNLGIGIGGLIGGAVLDIDRTWTFQAVYLADAASYLPILFLLLVPLRHVAGRAPREEEDAPASYAEVLRLPAVRSLTVLTLVVSFMAYGQLLSGLPAFARSVAEVSTRGLGIAFAANTAVIVVAQLVVLRHIEGRRRTRVLAVMGLVWTASWLLLGASGALPGTWGAAVLVAACLSVFALGETLLQPTLPAIVNDLATDRLRGRSNALNTLAFQVPMVLAPPISGWLLAHDQPGAYVGLLVIGSLLVAVIAIGWLEPRLGDVANGVAPPTGG